MIVPLEIEMIFLVPLFVSETSYHIIEYIMNEEMKALVKNAT